MITRILTFLEWADKRQKCRCKEEISACLPSKNRGVCIDCYEDYVTNCLSQSWGIRNSG